MVPICAKRSRYTGLWHLVLAFADIALHRRSPDELPASRFLFSSSLFVYIAVAIISYGVRDPSQRLAVIDILGSTFHLGFGLIILEVLFYLAFIWLALRLWDRSRRFLQTATALIGAQTLLSIVGVALLIPMSVVGASDEQSATVTIVSFLLFLWSMDITGFVLSRALQITYFWSLLIVIGYVMFLISLRQYVSPVTG